MLALDGSGYCSFQNPHVELSFTMIRACIKSIEITIINLVGWDINCKVIIVEVTIARFGGMYLETWNSLYEHD